MHSHEVASMSWSQIFAFSEAAVMTGSITSNRLGGVRPLVLDDDERPCHEDFNYGETFFTHGLFRPRWLSRRSCSPSPDLTPPAQPRPRATQATR